MAVQVTLILILNFIVEILSFFATKKPKDVTDQLALVTGFDV